MPTPTIFAGGAVDPFAEGAGNTPSQQVVIVTDREPSGSSKPAKFYSNDRGRELRAAIATVRIGEGLTPERVHDESMRHERIEEPIVKLVNIREIGSLTAPRNDARAFRRDIDTRLRAASRKEIDIIVHGYNTRFNENVELAAELRHYMAGDAVTISYAWPSRDSLFAYTVDKANAQYSVRFFRVLMELLAETKADRVNIVAHSAGAPIVVGAIRELRLMNMSASRDDLAERFRLGHIVLAAPDMDLLTFENALLDGFDLLPRNVTIYISTGDKALNLSAWVSGFARLGAPGDEMEDRDLERFYDSKTIQVIDVSSAESAHGNWLGHSYFYEDEWVSSDLLMLLQRDAAPRDRGLIRPIGDPFWKFPTDYPLRAVTDARELYGR
jgi:esterase/lipase superfamily enzyme